MAKEAYEPVRKKRFSVIDKTGPNAAQALAKERVGVVREYFDKCAGDLPGVGIAFGLYGSLTKGKKLRTDKLFGLRKGNLDKTDIDLAVYYDDVQLRKAILDQNPVVMRSLGTGSMPLEAISSDDEKGRDLRFRRVDDYIARAWYLQSRDLPHAIRMEQHSSPIGLTGSPDSIYANVIKLIQSGARPTLTEHEDIHDAFMFKRRIARAFALDFMGNLKQYRQDFVRHLLTLDPSEGERVWEYVAQLVVEWERLGDIPEEIQHQFPQTLSDAAKYYAVT